MTYKNTEQLNAMIITTLLLLLPTALTYKKRKCFYAIISPIIPLKLPVRHKTPFHSNYNYYVHHLRTPLIEKQALIKVPNALILSRVLTCGTGKLGITPGFDCVLTRK